MQNKVLTQYVYAKKNIINLLNLEIKERRIVPKIKSIENLILLHCNVIRIVYFKKVSKQIKYCTTNNDD